jgi:hypothetical protein
MIYSLWLEIGDEGRSLQFAGSSQQWQRPVDHFPGTAWARTPEAIYGGAYGCGEWLVFGCPEAGKGAGWCWSPACFSWSCTRGYIFLVKTKIVLSYRFWFCHERVRLGDLIILSHAQRFTIWTFVIIIIKIKINSQIVIKYFLSRICGLTCGFDQLPKSKKMQPSF